ncbi:hypothetical protein ACRZOS_000164 [Enterobacter kobei]
MMDSEVKKLLFVQQRLQILHLGKHYNEFSTAYIFAWDRGVYPYYDDTDGSVDRKPHEYYKNCFRIKESEVEFIIKRFNKAYDENKKLTFYGLEDELHVNSHTTSGWTRGKLLRICRYLFLEEAYDESFWDNLTENGSCPAEAHGIRRTFDRDFDIHFY